MHSPVKGLAGKWLHVAIPAGGALFGRMACLIFTFFSGWIVSLGINSFFGAIMGGGISFDLVFKVGAGRWGVLHEVLKDVLRGTSQECRADRLSSKMRLWAPGQSPPWNFPP